MDTPPAPGEFVGRQAYLGLLNTELDAVRRTGRGRFVLLRGRRRIGKSRLVNEFLRRATVPAVFHSATPAARERELNRFIDAVSVSTLPSADLVRRGMTVGGWDAALAMAASPPGGDACVIVIDELPYLVAGAPRSKPSCSTRGTGPWNDGRSCW